MASSTVSLSRRSLLAPGVLVGVLSLGVAVVAIAAPTRRAPAPFVALATGHVGKPYADHVRDAFDAPVSTYRLLDGTLPNGLALDATTGEVKGTPTEAKVARLRIGATGPGGGSLEVRASLAVFTATEVEVKKGQSFEGAGPFTTSVRTGSFNWKSSFDGRTRAATVLIYAPAASAGKNLPVLVHHRGRGFGHDDYKDFLSRIASWGIVCASVSDNQSFYSPRAPQQAEPDYDYNRAELGMLSASAAQEATLDYLLDLAATPGDALEGRLDAEAVFFAGHSRGGGATHASHTRSIPLRARGAIYFMAFDLRYFAETAPPATAPAYAIPTSQSRLPSLVFSAENDGDLSYPYADEFIDRATGPTTFVTVYGGVHNYLGDSNPAEGNATIARLDEQKRVASFVVAFIRRWAQDDLSLDGMLYGGELSSSKTVGVASWRRASPQLLVDDFQDSDVAKDKLGGAILATGLSRTEESIYPSTGDFDSLGLRHAVLALGNGASAFRLMLGPTGTRRDVSGYRNVTFRVLQTKADGWKLDMWVQLRDASLQLGSARLARATGASAGFLPAAGTVTGDRFVTLVVPLSLIKASNPQLDLTAIDRVSFVFGAPGSGRQVVVDDVRFE